MDAILSKTLIDFLNFFVVRCGRTIRIGVLANPSHLEAVDPVVIGRVRAELVNLNDEEGISQTILGSILVKNIKISNHY